MNKLDRLKNYKQNSLCYKPMKLVHGYPCGGNMTLEQELCGIRGTIDYIADIGYGGICTNTDMNHGYLENEEMWQLFRYALQYAHSKGMRTWVYDEKGYPSGGAGTLVLKDHPEWQAQGICAVIKSFAPGEHIKIDFPYRHNYVLSASAYKAENIDEITDDCLYKRYDIKGTQNGIDDVNASGTTLTVVYVLHKMMYEGTHAIHNCCESRRYVDVSNKDAIAKFIEVTYKRYCEHFDGCGEVGAFFTDEPSYMGSYINLALKCQTIVDEYDESMPMLPTVNWGAYAENRFEAEYGYNVLDYAYCLFGSESERARRVRLDFYRLMSKLYEEAFFAQIGDWCGGHGQKFSGHLLLEDSILYHPVFEGNFFSLMRHMHIPGIDMLNGIPEKVKEDCFTPKLVSSVAHAYGRLHVMSEISSHVQGGKVTPQQMLACVALQYVYGVDIFNSYFGENCVNREQYNVFNDTIGRIDCIMADSRHIADCAVYYPIETIQQEYIPQGRQIYDYLEENPYSSACWHSLRDVYYHLLDNQLDFDFLDEESIEKSSLADEKLTPNGGESFSVLIIPACFADEKLLWQVKRLTEKGVKVIYMQNERFANEAEKFAYCGADIVSDYDAIYESVTSRHTPELVLDGERKSIAYLCKDGSDGRAILMVNTENKPVKLTASVDGFGNNVKVYSPQYDKVIGEYESDGIELDFEEYGILMIL